MISNHFRHLRLPPDSIADLRLKRPVSWQERGMWLWYFWRSDQRPDSRRGMDIKTCGWVRWGQKTEADLFLIGMTCFREWCCTNVFFKKTLVLCLTCSCRRDQYLMLQWHFAKMTFWYKNPSGLIHGLFNRSPRISRRRKYLVWEIRLNRLTIAWRSCTGQHITSSNRRATIISLNMEICFEDADSLTQDAGNVRINLVNRWMRESIETASNARIQKLFQPLLQDGKTKTPHAKNTAKGKETLWQNRFAQQRIEINIKKDNVLPDSTVLKAHASPILI